MKFIFVNEEVIEMYIADKWGQGQIFAFSALDGKTCAENDFVGILSGDRLGIRFFTKVKRELALIPNMARNLAFEIVTGDCIGAVVNEEQYIRILYYDTHLVVGSTGSNTTVVTVFTEGRTRTECVGKVCVQDTEDGDYTALAIENEKFAFAYGKSAEEAVKRAEDGLETDVEEAYNKKWDYYNRHQLDNVEYGKLYSKCVSVMKTQLYSQEGRFGQIWSTPDRLPHRHLWLWDSVFHAVGYRNIDANIAEQLILSVFDSQYENGMIPHMSDTVNCSSITQPPVLAWGAWKVYEKSKNKDFLKKVFEKNRKFLLWCETNRRPDDEPLYSWKVKDDANCRCGESGMDNSPRFDSGKVLKAIDFSCFMTNEMRYMSKIASEIGEDALKYDKEFLKIQEAVNNRMWDESQGFYYDYSVCDHEFYKVETVASFLPLFAGICNKSQAKSLVSWLEDSETFGRKFPIPCLSAKHECFGTDMWRGPVWLNYNYLILSGLRDYGYEKLADKIQTKTLKNVNECYQRTGCLFEFYDSECKREPWSLNRKGPVVEPYDFRIRYQSIRDYGWSCTLILDMLHNLDF